MQISLPENTAIITLGEFTFQIVAHDYHNRVSFHIYHEGEVEIYDGQIDDDKKIDIQSGPLIFVKQKTSEQ